MKTELLLLLLLGNEAGLGLALNIVELLHFSRVDFFPTSLMKMMNTETKTRYWTMP
jgi:hypothetical protein